MFEENGHFYTSVFKTVFSFLVIGSVFMCRKKNKSQSSPTSTETELKQILGSRSWYIYYTKRLDSGKHNLF